jgi:hypothetical protein
MQILFWYELYVVLSIIQRISEYYFSRMREINYSSNFISCFMFLKSDRGRAGPHFPSRCPAVVRRIARTLLQFTNFKTLSETKADSLSWHHDRLYYGLQRTMQIHYSSHNRPPVCPILHQTTLVQNHHMHFSEIHVHFYISLFRRLWCSANNIRSECVLDSASSGHGLVARCCERGNEHPGFICGG